MASFVHAFQKIYLNKIRPSTEENGVLSNRKFFAVVVCVAFTSGCVTGLEIKHFPIEETFVDTKVAPVETESSKESKESKESKKSNKNRKVTIDFGGVPFAANIARVDPGEIPRKGFFSLISKAYGKQPPMSGSCRYDRPRSMEKIKVPSRDSVSKHTTAEKLPGLYGRTWHGMVGGHLVVINNLSVLKEENVAENLPEVKVYANYNPKKPKPTITYNPEINVYQGKKGYLIRAFFNGKGSINCIDILTPHEAPFLAKDGKIIYSYKGIDYVAKFLPHIAD